MAQSGYEPGGFIPPQTKPCASCGRPIDPKRALYSNTGDLICDGCFGTAGVNDRLTRAANGLAMGTLVTAIVSWFCNPFFILSVIAIGNAIGALRLLVRQDVKSALGSMHQTMLIVSILGLVIAGGRVLLDLGMLALALVLH